MTRDDDFDTVSGGNDGSEEADDRASRSAVTDLSRRRLLSGVAGAGATGLSIGPLSGNAAASQSESGKMAQVPEGADGDDSIVVENDVYQIDVGETESGFWIWPVETDSRQTTTLYHELFALQDGDGDVVPSYNPAEVVERFPDTGRPGEPYSCVVKYEVGGTELLVKRTVQMAESEPTFTIKYDVRNVGSATIDQLNFYQHADFDDGSNDFTDDVGYYQSSPEYVYTTDDGAYAGFSGSEPSVNHHVGEYPAYDALENGTLNNSDQFPSSGTDDPVCILQWDLGRLEPNGTTDITVQFGGTFSRERLEDNVEEPTEVETEPPAPAFELEFTDLRLVQTTEDTRYDENDTYDSYEQSEIDDASQFFGDPDSFVAEKAAAVVFDLEGNPTSANLPADVDFEVRVGDDTDTVTFSRDDVVIPATQDGNTLLGVAEDEFEAGDVPTFALDADAENVEVTLQSDDVTISRQTPLDRDVVEMPELNVGFVGIQGDGVAYGDLDESDYEDFVDEAARQFQAMYPTHRVNAVVADLSERYVSGDLFGFSESLTDLENGEASRGVIQDALTDSFTWGGLAPDDDSFADVFTIENGERDDSTTLDDVDDHDFTLGVVPNDYFDEVSGSASASGIHYSAQPYQPLASGLAELRSPSSAPHEGGHHFHGSNFYNQAIAQNNGNDTAHADANLRSTEYELTDSSFESNTAAPSYMSYGSDEWMETLAYDELLDDEMAATPAEGPIDQITNAISAIGEVTADGVEVHSRSLVSNQPVTDVPDGDVTATVYGADGSVVAEQGLVRGVEPQGTGHEPDERSDDVVFGTIEFPEDATYVEIEAPAPDPDGDETVTAVVNPFVDFLRDALLAVPEDHVSTAYEGYARSVSNRLDTVDRHVQNGRFGPAVNVLAALERTVQQRVQSGYDTAPSHVRAKSVIRSMISYRIDRLRSLDGGSPGGKGRGRGRDR